MKNLQGLLIILITLDLNVSQIENNLQKCNIELMSVGSMNKSLQAQNESLKQELQDLNKRNAEMRYASSQLVALQAQVKTMQENTLVLTKENVGLKQANSEQNRRILDLEEKNKMIAVLQEKNQALTKGFNEKTQLADNIPEMQKIIQQLTQNNIDYQNELNKTIDILNSSKTQNKTLIETIDNITGNLEIEKQNNSKQLNSNSELVKKAKELENLILQYQQRINELTNLVQNLKTENEKIPLYEKKLDELFDANDQFQKLVNDLKGQVENLKLQIKENLDASKNQTKSLENQIEQIYIKNTKLATELSDRESQLQRVIKANEILKELEKNISNNPQQNRTENENRALSQQVSLLNQNIEELNKTKELQKQNIGELQSKVNSLLIRLKDAVTNPVCDYKAADKK